MNGEINSGLIKQNATMSINSMINQTGDDDIMPTNGSNPNHRMSISAMLSSPSKGEDDTDEHEEQDIEEPKTDEIPIVLPETISSNDLILSFQSKLRGLVELDSLNYNEANQIKIMDREFKLLATTNGIFVEPKIIESLKAEALGLEGKLLEKLLKRDKIVQNEADELKQLKTNEIKRLEAQQTLKEDEIIQAKIDASQPTKILKRSKRQTKKKVQPADTTSSEFIDIAPKRRRRRAGTAVSATLDDVPTTATGKRRRRAKAADLEDKNVKQPVIKKRKRAKSVSGDGSTGVEKTGKGKAADDNGKVSRRGGKRAGSGPKKSVKTKTEEEEEDDMEADEQKLEESEAKLPKIKLTLKPKISAKEQKAIDKQYDNTYISIWKDMARKDGPKAYRLFQQSTQAKQINLRKTALLAARESKKWQMKTNKSQKDLQTKARRSMREMLNFWKKNEKEERNLRVKAEQEAVNKAKKEEEAREARRQSRKLNFLLNQTELYSHFIGKKIKTDEFEGDMSDKAHAGGAKTVDIDEVDMAHANNDFESIDFGDGNDEKLKKTAAANAQSALMEAQKKAQAFNNEGEMNFQNPTSIGDINITQPKLLNCTLKEYQVKGLNWLANLYEQGINGILADEMGLGKTVQSISVLSYLAETHNIWGPFLVVTPASTLHNWQQEITRFVPDFKVLPYWGTAKDRKVLRKFWDRKSIVYHKDSPIHVVVTSYQLVVADIQYFRKMKWQYMILDEAQAIKSSNSSRWKSLLSFQCRNRLLLTGTPIQNSMQELWALLHFIMPSLFDSHDEFSEWFSKDIEAHAQSNTQLNEQQLRKLHVILKPFMLRRIKKNVQSELGDKIEIDVYCDLTNRQKKLYRMLRSQINIMDLIDNSKKIGNDDDNSGDSLMNVVMQFRKVCNHPDLFERADTKSAFSISRFAETSSFLRENNATVLDVQYSTRNIIEYELPTLVHDEILTPGFDNSINDKQNLLERFSIWNPENIQKSENFSFLKFVDTTSNEAIKQYKNNAIKNAIESRSYVGKTKGELIDRFKFVYQHQNEDEPTFTPTEKLFLIDYPELRNKEKLKNLVSVQDTVYKDMYLNVAQPCAFPIVSAPPIQLNCSRNRMNSVKSDILFNREIRTALQPLSLNIQLDLIEKKVPLEHWPKAEMGVPAISSQVGYSSIRLPAMKRFVIESGKLAQLDKMLVDLKKGGHKCLVYFQMTKMMDLMEEFLTYRQYKYIRLDGSSKLSDRRDLVHDWQTKPELFIFLLSTRAGGLGINLTAADTVIFYDSDWNPTIDSQAMDRAHRLGQTRQVTVYRLMVKGTIEERMRDRAKQKEHVQQVVMEGKSTAVGDKKDKEKKEMAMWLLDDSDDKDSEELQTSNHVVSSNTDEAKMETVGAETKKEEETDQDGDVVIP